MKFSQPEWDTGDSVPGAFKLDHLQPDKLILFQKLSTFSPSPAAPHNKPILYTPERGGREAARAENRKRELFKSEWHQGVSDPGAFKLDHLQHFKLILIQIVLKGRRQRDAFHRISALYCDTTGAALQASRATFSCAIWDSETRSLTASHAHHATLSWMGGRKGWMRRLIRSGISAVKSIGFVWHIHTILKPVSSVLSLNNNCQSTWHKKFCDWYRELVGRSEEGH